MFSFFSKKIEKIINTIGNHLLWISLFKYYEWEHEEVTLGSNTGRFFINSKLELY